MVGSPCGGLDQSRPSGTPGEGTLPWQELTKQGGHALPPPAVTPPAGSYSGAKQPLLPSQQWLTTAWAGPDWPATHQVLLAAAWAPRTVCPLLEKGRVPSPTSMLLHRLLWMAGAGQGGDARCLDFGTSGTALCSGGMQQATVLGRVGPRRRAPTRAVHVQAHVLAAPVVVHALLGEDVQGEVVDEAGVEVEAAKVGEGGMGRGVLDVMELGWVGGKGCLQSAGCVGGPPEQPSRAAPQFMLAGAR